MLKEQCFHRMSVFVGSQVWISFVYMLQIFSLPVPNKFSCFHNFSQSYLLNGDGSQKETDWDKWWTAGYNSCTASSTLPRLTEISQQSFSSLDFLVLKHFKNSCGYQVQKRCAGLTGYWSSLDHMYTWFYIKAPLYCPASSTLHRLTGLSPRSFFSFNF